MVPGKLASILAGQILSGGYQGSLYAVNPKGEGASGHPPVTHPCGPSPTSRTLRSSSLLLLLSPPYSTDCGKAGIRSAVIITSGFSEAGNQPGNRKSALSRRQHGIRFIGPNCAGIASAGFDFFPTLEMRPPAGGVALISQSGALGGVVLGGAAESLGISKFISYGNGSGPRPG